MRLDILPDLKVRGFSAQTAIAVWDCLTSPNESVDAPTDLIIKAAFKSLPNQTLLFYQTRE